MSAAETPAEKLAGGHESSRRTVFLDASVCQDVATVLVRGIEVGVAEDQRVRTRVEFGEGLGGGCRDIDGIPTRLQDGLQSQPGGQFAVDQQYTG